MPPLASGDGGRPDFLQDGMIPPAPGLVPTDVAQNPAQAPELITAAAFAVPSPEVSRFDPPRYIIKAMPDQAEFDAGSTFEGDEGQFRDAARLLGLLEVYDPERRLADAGYRAELIAHSDVAGAKQAIAMINGALCDTDGLSHFADREVMLVTGSAETERVGFIGIHPMDADALLSVALDGVKFFAEAGKLQEAGRLAANILVPLQLMRDGNKRMARAFYELIAYGYDGSVYEQVAMRERLGFTREARDSFYYKAQTYGIKIAFQQDQLPREQRASFYHFSMGWSGVSEKAVLSSALANVADPDLRKSTVGILQQHGFGARYVFESTDPALIAEYSKAFNVADKQLIMNVILENFAKGMSDESARSLIETDRKARNLYVERLVRSTTGENKLPLFYDANGDPIGDVYADLTS